MIDEAPGRHPLMPSDTPDHMASAWIGCISWALKKPEILAAYRAEIGDNFAPGKTALDNAIDKATGRDRAFIESFIKWVNERVWGPIEGGSP